MSEEKPASCAIIALHGTLDLAYPPLIIASTAVAMDMQATIFFTFYGLEILKKNLNLQVSPIANPAAPPPLSAIPIGVPNIVGMLPGMTAMATGMMKGWMKSANVATIPKLLEACQKGGVRMIGCLMTMNVMGIKKEDLIDGIELGGAGTFVDVAADSSFTLSF